MRRHVFVVGVGMIPFVKPSQSESESAGERAARASVLVRAGGLDG
ncbi:hypothetical protein [Microbispora sitophila]|nr:hypothetical protein [Microbispora sitophila]